MLTVDDFDTFFHDVHEVEPFRWQKRLLHRVVEDGRWPEILDLPTGAGKTAAMDIALFHLALEADRGPDRKVPVRIAFVVDRRLIVDDVFRRAERLVAALATPEHESTRRVAERLRLLSGADAPPLIARQLRGGIPREDDWARTPAQPTILCSTVDQVGSRLLFRGYGVSDSMKPVHAGLLGADCLILLDEAHLAEPFRQTLHAVGRYRGPRWRTSTVAAPWGVALLTATPGETAGASFSLEDEDDLDQRLRVRLDASKPARLVETAKRRSRQTASENGRQGDDVSGRVAAIVEQVTHALEHFAEPTNGAPVPAIGVVVNRVARARAVFQTLGRQLESEDVELLIGPARPADRRQVESLLAPIRTGADRALDRPLILVATQCIEAGVDVDLDALITEAAPLDALRQRFGRLNRAGREINPFGAVVASKSDLGAKYVDPVYGTAIRAAWDRLRTRAADGDTATIDFGVRAFDIVPTPDETSPHDDAPVLLPAHVDLLSQTSPLPAADPDVSVFLHGSSREPDSVTVVWRADIEGLPDELVRRILLLAPPRPGETIQLPVWAVRRWLGRERPSDALADAPGADPDDSSRRGTDERPVFRWRGDDERSQWITPSRIAPGDTIVAPSRYGGADRYGWNPAEVRPVEDIGALAGRDYAARRFVVRVAPGLIGTVQPESLSAALADTESRSWRDLRATLTELDLPAEVQEGLTRLDQARAARRMRSRVEPVRAYLDAYGLDRSGRPRGIILVAPFGIESREDVTAGPGSTEDDLTGSLSGAAVPLHEHLSGVSRLAETYAKRAGLPGQLVEDLRIAGLLHDLGKADRRFQAWMHHGDPLGPDPDDPRSVLAKSGRELPRTAREAAGLPPSWRHESLSVRLAPLTPEFSRAVDPELVLWLIGSHHGYGRVLFPHEDPDDSELRTLPAVNGLPGELPPGPGPQALAWDRDGLDWPSLCELVKARYGIWDLARYEAILRLADHRASEAEAIGGDA